MDYPTQEQQVQAIITLAYYRGNLPRKAFEALQVLINRLDYYELKLSEAADAIKHLTGGNDNE